MRLWGVAGGYFSPPLGLIYMQGSWSELEVNRVGGRSRLTSCLSLAPLKILTPGAEADYSSAVLSSYGGGLLAGDCARLRVRCGREAKLFLGTQAFTKIYKAVDGRMARQEIEGCIAKGGCVVSLPDPVVPYAASVFVQEQVWRLDEGALLVLLDGATAGRSERGECFQYSSYISNITVYLQDELVLVERLDSQPGQQAPARVGVFGEYTAFANAFIIGVPGSRAFTAIDDSLRDALSPLLARQPDGESEQQEMVSLVAMRPGVLVLRALGRTNEGLDKVIDALAIAVAQPEVLGANPLRRKY